MTARELSQRLTTWRIYILYHWDQARANWSRPREAKEGSIRRPPPIEFLQHWLQFPPTKQWELLTQFGPRTDKNSTSRFLYLPIHLLSLVIEWDCQRKKKRKECCFIGLTQRKIELYHRESTWKQRLLHFWSAREQFENQVLIDGKSSSFSFKEETKVNAFIY